MYPSPWLRKLFNVARFRKDRRRRAAPNHKTIRLLLESLEERLTPSSPQTAGSYTDLVNAIAADTASNTNYDIQITQSFTFDSGGQVSISKLGSGSTLTIEGQNGTNDTLTGNGNRLFTVGSAQNVTFKDLTLTRGGNVNLGGAILDQGGNVTLSKVAVLNNTVSGGSADGGGVSVSRNGTLSIQGGSAIQSNHARGTGYFTTAKGAKTGNSASGGGLYVSTGSTVTIQNSTLRNNTVLANEAVGGGVCVFGTSKLTVQGGSTIQSNRATGTGTYPATNGVKLNNYASGGGLYVYGATTVQISDSSIDNNTAQGGRGADGTATGARGKGGGLAYGGGVYVSGSGWNATLIGVSLSGNAAIGGNGGNGAAGSNAIGKNTRGGNGGSGGDGGSAAGGAAYFGIFGSDGSSGSGSLRILNDLSNPTANPSIVIDNSVQGGSGGNGGTGGTSTGTANNSDGGDGGMPLNAWGGALYLISDSGAAANINIGNTTFYGNKVTGGNGGVGGAAGTSGSGTAGKAGANQEGASAYGGGILFNVQGGSVTLVNSTVANNIATTGLSPNGGSGNGVPGSSGGGIDDGDPAGVTDTFDNNTITQNTVRGIAAPNGVANFGAGFLVGGSNPTLFNNLIQGNQSVGSFAADFQVFPTFSTPLSNATDNFIGSMSTNAVSTTTNIVGNSQTQLSSVVGLDSNGKPTGGPVYYPLLSGVASIGAGTTSDLNTIASVEGTTTSAGTDEIGNPRTSKNAIDLGAVEYQMSPTVTTNPSNQTVTAGSTATFTAAANGNPTPTVQWQVSTDGGKTWTALSGATSNTLTLNNVLFSQNGDEYRAVFSNTVGSSFSNAATLTVQTPPAVTSGSNAAFTVGQSGSFTLTATGSPTPSLTLSGVLPSGVTFINNGNGTATLHGIPAPGASGTYYFTITAHNGTGSDALQNFTLVVSPSAPKVPPLLVFLAELLGGIETVNAHGTSLTGDFFGIPLLAATFDDSGNLQDATLLGLDITFLVNLLK